MSNDIAKSILEFDTFLNHPHENEDMRKVRDYRHEAYQLWKEVLKVFEAQLSQPQEAVAWATDDYRFCSNETKKLTMHKTTANNFNIPLFKAPPNYEALLKENEKLKEEIRNLKG